MTVTMGGGLLAIGGHIVMLVGVVLPWLQSLRFGQVESVSGLDFATAEVAVGLNPLFLVAGGVLGLVGSVAVIADGGEYRRPGAAVAAIGAVVGLVVVGSVYLAVDRMPLGSMGMSFGLGFWLSGLGAILALIGGAYEALLPDAARGAASVATATYVPPSDPAAVTQAPSPATMTAAAVPTPEPERATVPRTPVQAAMDGRSWSRVARRGALPGRWEATASIIDELPAGTVIEAVETADGVEIRGASGEVFLALAEGSYAVSVPADDAAGTRLVSASRGPTLLLRRIGA